MATRQSDTIMDPASDDAALVPRRRRVVYSFALSLGLCSMIACGPSSGAPTLFDLRCVDDDACQSLADPFLLDLLVDFEDEDGDLGAGTYSVYVDGFRTDGPWPLLEHFEAAGLSAYATEGTLSLPSGVQLSGIQSGMTFVVGLEVEDFAGNGSNRPGILFRLDLH